MNDYGAQYDDYDPNVGEYVGGGGVEDEDDDDVYLISQSTVGGGGMMDEAVNGNMMGNNPNSSNINFEAPQVAALPRILLMGPRRGGKTSIEHVVFQKMSPHETLFRLEPTLSLERSLVDHTTLCRFTIHDFPGDYYGEDMPEQAVFAAGPTSLIFVVDAQDEPYDHVLQSFTSVVTRALQVNPQITVEVFINKVDGELFLSDESKYDCRRDIMTQVTDELNDAGIPDGSLAIRYHLTSIYDHSIYEALSRVVQRLIPQLPTLENLLNVLTATCSMEKAYLFDVVSKLYISTDSGPVDMQSVELCSDMIDVVLDVSGIYGLPNNSNELAASSGNNNGTDTADTTTASSSTAEEGQSSGTPAARPANPDAELQEGWMGGGSNEEKAGENGDANNEAGDNPSAYDSETASVIRLSNGMVLYLKEVDTMLALVCITRAENFTRRSLINYNISCLKQALGAIVDVTKLDASTETPAALNSTTRAQQQLVEVAE